MFFIRLKPIGGTVSLLGLGTSLYFLLEKPCSFEKASHLYKSSLNISESVLDCKEGDRNYSVFLAFKDHSGLNTQDSVDLSFKVVDNNDNGKVRWGPGVEMSQKWTDWGIAIHKNNSKKASEEDFKTIIRVPRKGNIYDKSKSWTSLIVSCQKSLLKLKDDWSEGCKQCGGRYVKSANMTFEIQDNNVKMSKVFDWKDGFQPKRIFCSS